MKQKYVLTKEDDKLIVKEYAELEPGLYSLLCEESFAAEKVEAAIPAGTVELVGFLRTHNMYPPEIFAAPIAEAVIEMFDKGTDRRELLFDDSDFINNDKDRSSSFDNEEEEMVDDLIDEEEESEESFDEDDLKDIEGGADDAPAIKLTDDDKGIEA